MKQFGIIYRHELKGHVKNKAFVGVTIFLVLIIALAMFFPRIKNSFSGSSDGGGASESKSSFGICVGDGVDAELAKNAFLSQPDFESYDIVVETDELKLKDKVVDGTYEFAFAIRDLTNYTYYVNNLSIMDERKAPSEEAMKQLNYREILKKNGAADAEIDDLVKLEVIGEPVALGADQSKNYFYAYIMIFALYMIILLYGQMVSTNVASEKSSRAMEVLITSAKPTALMFGKILAACTAGMGQLILIFGTAFVSYQITADDWGNNMLIDSIFNIPLEMVLYMLLFFLLGFLLYAMLFGAIGSMATKVEDINTLQTPITILFVAGFLIVVMSMGSNVNSTLMIVASYFPFTSPMAMFTRIAMGDIPVWEVVISVVILIVSVAVCGVAAARIYRAGVLHYGKPPKFTEMLAKVKQKQ